MQVLDGRVYACGALPEALAVADMPTGTITFLFTDVEGSTRLWEAHPQAMRQAMARHDALLTAVFERHDGIVVRPRGEGDSLFAVFVRASDAVAAALAGQRALTAEDWGESGPLRVRMGLHTGEADLREGDYYGSAVNRCARIRAAGHGGQILLSEATAKLVRGALPGGASLLDLGRHRLKDIAEPEQLYQLAAPGLAAAFPPLKTLDHRPNNLPALLTSFIGRERELAEIGRLLGEARLLTLTGPGGTGKTRLALQAAAELFDDFPDGVFFVDLAPLADPTLVPAAIAQVVDVREQPGVPLRDSLTHALRDKRALLLLDNFEHLLAAADTVALLLQSASAIAVLTTSRAPLRLRGEREYPVAPLLLPSAAQLTPADAAQNPAAALFVARARDVRPEFGLTDENAATVAAICRRLEGMPLAIELAAARVRVLLPPALLARLEYSLAVLTGGARDAPERHRTLRDTIAWSYRLLTHAEQVLFRRMAVFAGGCTMDAVEAVCVPVEGGDDGTIAGASVLDLATSLVEKSLLRLARGDEPRFMMLETIREFAQEQLASAEEEAQLSRRHAEYILRFVERGDAARRTAAAHGWIEMVEAEEDNVRSALAWAVRRGEAEAGSRLLAAMRWFWMLRGRMHEGQQWTEAVLALPGSADATAPRARALLSASFFATMHSNHGLARAYAEESAAISRAIGHLELLAQALLELGHLLRTDAEQARPLLEEGLRLYQDLGHAWGRAVILNGIAVLAMRAGDGATARPLFEQSYAMLRECGDDWMANAPLRNLARLAAERGEIGAALAMYEEALDLARTIGSVVDIVETLQSMILLHLRERRTDGLATFLAETLQLTIAAGLDPAVQWGLEIAGAVAYAHRMTERAVRLWGAAEAQREAHGEWRTTAFRSQYDATVAGMRRRLGEDTFAAAWKAGRELRVDQAVTDALALAAELQAEEKQSDVRVLPG